MINHPKRRTLKTLVTMAGTAISGLGVAASSIAAPLTTETGKPLAGSSSGKAHSGFTVSTRHNAHTNDVDIVITNTDTQPVSITKVFPDTLDTARGTFNTASITANGPVTLQGQQSLTVPLEHSAIDNFNQTHRLPVSSVKKAVSQQLGLVVNHNQMASLEVQQASYA